MTAGWWWFFAGSCFGAALTLVVVIAQTKRLAIRTARRLEAHAFRRAGRITLAHHETAEGRHAAFRLLSIADDLERVTHATTPER